MSEQLDTGVKHDAGKDPWDLLPWEPVTDIVRVLEHGARKYAPENWRKVPNARSRYFAALMRHLLAWWKGERLDPDSGLPHLACAGCSLLFLAALDQAKPVHEPQREDQDVIAYMTRSGPHR